MNNRITVKGAKDFRNMLKRLESKTKRKQILRAGSRAVGSAALKVMKANAPKDEGDLVKSQKVVVRSKGCRMSTTVGADGSYSRDDGKHLNGKMPYFYDHLANDGFETRDGRSVPGTHYVEKAAAQIAPQADQIMTKKVLEGLEREMRKGK